MERKGVEEGARTGRGNGDGVEVARRSRGRPSEPIKAHNLERNVRTAMVRPFVAVIIRDYKII